MFKNLNLPTLPSAMRWILMTLERCAVLRSKDEHRIVGAALLLLTGSAAAQDGGKVIPKTTITLGTATPGGGFPLYGNPFAEVMNEADPALAIEPRNTKGSNENIPLLEEGKLDSRLVAGEPSYEAFMEIGRPRTKI